MYFGFQAQALRYAHGLAVRVRGELRLPVELLTVARVIKPIVRTLPCGLQRVDLSQIQTALPCRDVAELLNDSSLQ